MAKRTITGRNGGELHPQQVGEPGKPGAGRKHNPFREAIRDFAESEQTIILKGRILDVNGNPTGQPVQVAVSLPGAVGVVIAAYKKAPKDVRWAKWITDNGWDKTVKLGNDEDSPLGGGFVLVLPENKR